MDRLTLTLPLRKASTAGNIAFVGSHPSKTDIDAGRVLGGGSGSLLNNILCQSKIVREDCLFTNVFMTKPANGINSLYVKKKDANAQYKELRDELLSSMFDIPLPSTYTWKLLGQGKYIAPRYLPELARLKSELEANRPNVVVALGNVACWALLGDSGITKMRGTVCESSLITGLKVIPVFDPAMVMKQWNLLPVLQVDMKKVQRESLFPEIIRPIREIWIDPDLEAIEYFIKEYLTDAEIISYDIETRAKQITCIGFTADGKRGICIPFVDSRKPSYSYWETQAEEIAAWELVRQICTDNAPKLAQNGMYDMQYLYRVMGIPVMNASADTMLCHHALQPEMKKDLGFLGSVYTNEASWKSMRKRAKDEIEKVDD